MDAILLEWEQFTKTLLPGRYMSVIALRDHAQEILEAVMQAMSEIQSGDEQENKSKGGDEDVRLQQSAQHHVSTRLVEGFDFDQIVSEYRALRASVIRLWTDEMQSADTILACPKWTAVKWRDKYVQKIPCRQCE